MLTGALFGGFLVTSEAASFPGPSALGGAVLVPEWQLWDLSALCVADSLSGFVTSFHSAICSDEVHDWG